MTYWNETVTVYHQSESVGVVNWESKVYHNCFCKIVKSMNGYTEMTTKAANIVRIPDGAAVSVGDIVVRGNSSFVIDELTSGKRSNDLLETEEAFIVRTVARNTNAPIPHYRIEG